MMNKKSIFILLYLFFLLQNFNVRKKLQTGTEKLLNLKKNFSTISKNKITKSNIDNNNKFHESKNENIDINNYLKVGSILVPFIEEYGHILKYIFNLSIPENEFNIDLYRKCKINENLFDNILESMNSFAKNISNLFLSITKKKVNKNNDNEFTSIDINHIKDENELKNKIEKLQSKFKELKNKKNNNENDEKNIDNTFYNKNYIEQLKKIFTEKSLSENLYKEQFYQNFCYNLKQLNNDNITLKFPIKNVMSGDYATEKFLEEFDLATNLKINNDQNFKILELSTKDKYLKNNKIAFQIVNDNDKIKCDIGMQGFNYENYNLKSELEEKITINEYISYILYLIFDEEDNNSHNNRFNLIRPLIFASILQTLIEKKQYNVKELIEKFIIDTSLNPNNNDISKVFEMLLLSKKIVNFIIKNFNISEDNDFFKNLEESIQENNNPKKKNKNDSSFIKKYGGLITGGVIASAAIYMFKKDIIREQFRNFMNNRGFLKDNNYTLKPLLNSWNKKNSISKSISLYEFNPYDFLRDFAVDTSVNSLIDLVTDLAFKPNSMFNNITKNSLNLFYNYKNSNSIINFIANRDGLNSFINIHKGKSDQKSNILSLNDGYTKEIINVFGTKIEDEIRLKYFNKYNIKESYSDKINKFIENNSILNKIKSGYGFFRKGEEIVKNKLEILDNSIKKTVSKKYSENKKNIYFGFIYDKKNIPFSFLFISLIKAYEGIMHNVAGILHTKEDDGFIGTISSIYEIVRNVEGRKIHDAIYVSSKENKIIDSYKTFLGKDLVEKIREDLIERRKTGKYGLEIILEKVNKVEFKDDQINNKSRIMNELTDLFKKSKPDND